ncbi:MAG: hypothetical protein M1546_05215 [Chloroflexi bacterium]|nr:hypothetical protein [Chloroflexota bacterium]
MLQDLLNRAEQYQWGFVSNGSVLRVLRDSARLTRQAYVEFDLQAMMDGEAFSNFMLLWLVCHQSRIESPSPSERGGEGEGCWLERWSHTAQQQGMRARDQLRGGVERAIKALGSGFLACRANAALRDKLRSGALSKEDYYRQLLRLVYRLLFVFVAEDRGLLLDPQASPTARDRYTRYYSTAQLRELAGRRIGTRHADRYRAFRAVTDKLSCDEGCPALGLPALGGFLFSPQALPDLEGCDIANTDWFGAVRALAFIDDRDMRLPVDYKNLGPEELGSIYESLLELHPNLNVDAATFELDVFAGSERKTTGSYYTNPDLVGAVLDSALEPVINAKLKEAERLVHDTRGTESAKTAKHAVHNAQLAARALLSIRLCDAACGSGHFLIAAAYRIARRLAVIETGDVEPSPQAMQHALRQVIGQCIYGVDINPLAVELCKFNLWLASLDPGKPLTFLDQHIQCGNSLIGATPELIMQGIPNTAYAAISGDDKSVAAGLRKRNAQERDAGQLGMHLVAEERAPYGNLPSTVAGIYTVDDERVDGVRERAQRYAAVLTSPEYRKQELLADAWCAAFVMRKVPATTNMLAAEPITQATLNRIAEDPDSASAQLRAEINRLAGQYQFFHWHLAFPEVFGEKDGFDVIAGNPPWERIKLQEKEWFATRRPEIANAPNATARKRMIAALCEQDPVLHKAFMGDARQAEGESHFARNSGRYPLTAVGDVNTYPLFAELARQLISPSGRAGVIVPTGIATDDTTKAFFGDLSKTRTIASLFDFENRYELFHGVHRSYKFCLLTVSGEAMRQANFVFFATQVEHLKDGRRRFTLVPDEISLFNPNTRTSPLFRTRQDADLVRSIYLRIPILVNDALNLNPWKAFYMRLVDLGDHAEDIRFPWQEKDIPWSIPLFESKMVTIFDHRYTTFDGLGHDKYQSGQPRELTLDEKCDPCKTTEPRYFVRNGLVEALFNKYPNYNHRWLIVWRDVARSTDERTSMGAVIPHAVASRTCPAIGFDNKAFVACGLVANINSLVFDYVARQKVGGIHFNWTILEQLPVIPPDRYSKPDMDFIAQRVMELVYTAWDLQPFAQDVFDEVGMETWSRWFPAGPLAQGDPPQPFTWDPERRAHLRAELDGYYAKLYGLTRDELRYILDPKDVYGPDFPGETFRVLKEREEREYGEYRTRRLVLEAWDRMFESQ